MSYGISSIFDEVIDSMQLTPHYEYGRLQALDFLKAMDTDSLPSSHPISVQVDHPTQIGEIFDSISYKKGTSSSHN